MKRNRLIIFLFVVVTTTFIGVGVLFISDAPSTTPTAFITDTVPKTPQPIIQTEELIVLKPIAFDNLQLFPIVGKAKLNNRVYVTLNEAMKNNMVRLSETGEVNELSIDNMSTAYIFIQAGDIVKGGKQDRTLQTDLILPPKAIGVALNSFCVEQGRWRKRENEDVAQFSLSERNLSSRDLKIASKKEANQREVWGKVKEQQDKLNRNVSYKYDEDIALESEISETSYQLTLENEKLEEFNTEYKTQLASILKTENILGMAYAINGEIYGMDVFNNTQLFSDLSNKLMDAFIIEAISNRNDTLSFKMVTPAMVTNLLELHKTKKPTNENTQALNQVTQYEFQEFGLVNRYITTDTELKNWLHLNYLIAEEESQPEVKYNLRR